MLFTEMLGQEVDGSYKEPTPTVIDLLSYDALLDDKASTEGQTECRDIDFGEAKEAIVGVSKQLEELMTKIKQLSNVLNNHTRQFENKEMRRMSRELTKLLHRHASMGCAKGRRHCQ